MQILARSACVLALLLGMQCTGAISPIHAANYTWSGGNGVSWSNSGNWSGSVPASGATTGLIFSSAGSYAGNPNNDTASPFSLWQLTVASGAPAIHLTGGGLAFSTTSQSGIFQNASTATTIDNPLSWSGSNSLALSLPGTGSLLLTGGLTTTGPGVVTKSGIGSLTFTGSNTLAGAFSANGGTTAISSGSFGSANLTVGNTSPATLTISGSGTKVNVGNALDVNYGATASGSTAFLNLQGGTLSVAGAAIIGRARMDTSPADTSAQVNQTGGLFQATGQVIIGQTGLAQSLYNVSGGTLAASAGLTVGAQGDGVLNISGSGNVVVSGTAGLSVGGDPSGATSGTVDLTAGMLSIGNLILGNGGAGALVRSGGSLTASGNLVAAGAGTLVLNGSAGSVATYFAGKLTNCAGGSLVVIPQTGQPSGNEALTFGQSSALTDNILGTWDVRQLSGTSSQGDYLTLAGTTAPYSLATANYSSTNFNTSSGRDKGGKR